jgi:tryptophan 2,3-dioxygenase
MAEDAPTAPPTPDSLEFPGAELITYNSYLEVPALLDLQRLKSQPPMHDELLFITIHQAYELWFKQIIFELDSVAERMKAGDIFEARRLLERVIVIEKLLVQQIHVLETMTPRDFASFRSILNPASGFQSIQFREVEFLTGIKDAKVMRGIRLEDSERARLEARLAAPSLRDIFYAALRDRGFDVTAPGDDGELDDDARERTLAALLTIYQAPEHHFHLYNLAESLVSHDQCILLWRFHHVRVVERLIGSKRGTGGSAGVRYLSSTLVKRAYPMLWEARAHLDDASLYGKERGLTSPDYPID